MASGCRCLLNGQLCPLNGEWALFSLGTLESHAKRSRTGGRGETSQDQDFSYCPGRIVYDKMPNYRALEHKASEAGLHVSASLLERDHEL